MGSFNAHCVRKATYGGSTPIWLGVVTPLPAGGVLASGFVKEKTLIPAGSPIKFDSGTITPLLFAEVVSSTSGSPNDTIVVKKPLYGQFAVGDLIQKVVQPLPLPARRQPLSALLKTHRTRATSTLQLQPALWTHSPKEMSLLSLRQLPQVAANLSKRSPTRTSTMIFISTMPKPALTPPAQP